MSVTVQFSVTSKRENSTLIPEMRDSAECTFKNGCSMLNPTLLLNIRTDTFPDYTFFKIGNRYYRVKDIRSVRNDLFEIDGEVDVLATYKSQIGSSSQYVLRSAATFDGTVSDSFYPTKALKNYARVSHSTKFIFPQAGAFVFGIQGLATGSGQTFGSTTYYVMDIYQASAFMNEVFNIQNSQYDAASVESEAGIPEEVYKSIINPQQYITSCMFLPFDAESVGGSHSVSSIKLGWYEMSASARIFDSSFDTLPSVEDTFTLSKHPQNSRGIYMNNAPYTEYILSIMPFGDIPLPADLLLAETQIHYKVIVDVLTGQGTLKIYAGASDSGQLLESQSAQIGVPIAISGGVYDYTPRDIKTKAIAGALIESAIAGKTGRDAILFNGVMDAVKSPSISTAGSNGALDFLEYPVILYSRFTRVVDDDNAQHGRPLCAVRQINTLGGYTVCLKPELSLPATITEKEEVIRYMQTGFFYE